MGAREHRAPVSDLFKSINPFQLKCLWSSVPQRLLTGGIETSRKEAMPSDEAAERPVIPMSRTCLASPTERAIRHASIAFSHRARYHGKPSGVRSGLLNPRC